MAPSFLIPASCAGPASTAGRLVRGVSCNAPPPPNEALVGRRPRRAARDGRVASDPGERVLVAGGRITCSSGPLRRFLRNMPLKPLDMLASDESADSSLRKRQDALRDWCARMKMMQG